VKAAFYRVEEEVDPRPSTGISLTLCHIQMFENNILLAFGTVSVTTNIQQYSSKVYLGTFKTNTKPFSQVIDLHGFLL
jgi:hypothetical protein